MTSSGTRSPDFDARAAAYDRLRPIDDSWLEIFETVVREGSFRGQRVLDIGCGTGRFCGLLAERGIARVWGVDPSLEMLARAQQQVPSSVGLKRGSAEDLPFKDAWFDGAAMWTVVHLVDRARAFAECHRVVRPGGWLAIVTFDPEHFRRFWLNEFFPSIERVDSERHPTPEALSAELAAAGFRSTRFLRPRHEFVLERELALERIRGRSISTFDLLGEDELRNGLERAERELPERVKCERLWLLAFAER